MVTAELAGSFEAPVYGMIDVGDAIDAEDWGGLPKPGDQPARPAGRRIASPSLLWDGEWEVTWVTFRDMGAAFMVALLGIYILVVAQFGSFKLPLVILTPIPLTLIGIMFGHWLFNAPFTATSMIGFIALAGIIVRNSILLVDFIRHARTPERPLVDVLLEAGAIRFKPILLTAHCRHDRRRRHPCRPDFPGPGHLAALWPCLVNGADGAGDPGHLCGAQALTNCRPRKWFDRDQ